MGTSKTLDKVTYVVTKVNETLLLIALSVMFVLVFANVIGRYVFSNSISWATEISRYLMVSSAFLGMGLAMKQNRHSAFFIFQDLLPGMPRKILRVIDALVIIAVMGILLIFGAQYAFSYMENLTEVLRWPVGYWYLTIPLGALLFIYHFISSFVEYINKKKDADLEEEILAGEKLVGASVFLKQVIDTDIAEEDRKGGSI